ncbi:MAG: hypothetical protein LBQ22_01940 [Bacteroidales bacterium]|jgi:hypothetical protein|nr:hypothetical protein [Bacteroidales bacterium]
MAFSRKFLLKRVKEVNEIYMNHSKRGLSNEYIYRNYIRNVFHISRSTFYEYLTIPYAKEIKEIENKEKEQPKSFDDNKTDNLNT